MADSAPRRFAVHAIDEAPARAHLLDGGSFEDAALGFVEEWHATAEGQAVIIVEDCQSGEQQCFRVDLGTGEAAPCD